MTNCGIGINDRQRGVRGALRRALIKRRGEPFTFRLTPSETEPFLASTGWTITDTLSGPQVAARHLVGTDLAPDNLNRDGLLFLTARPTRPATR